MILDHKIEREIPFQISNLFTSPLQCQITLEWTGMLHSKNCNFCQKAILNILGICRSSHFCSKMWYPFMMDEVGCHDLVIKVPLFFLYVCNCHLDIDAQCLFFILESPLHWLIAWNNNIMCKDLHFLFLK